MTPHQKPDYAWAEFVANVIGLGASMMFPLLVGVGIRLGAVFLIGPVSC